MTRRLENIRIQLANAERFVRRQEKIVAKLRATKDSSLEKAEEYLGDLYETLEEARRELERLYSEGPEEPN